MPPGPPSPASIPKSRKTSSRGAPKRSAIRLDRMPVRTSRLPNSIARLTASSELIASISLRYRRVSRAQEQPERLPLLSRRSKCHLVAALEREDFARLVRGRDVKAEPFQDLSHLGDLLGVRFSQLARAYPERILHADPNVAAYRSGNGRNPHLVGACAEHRPMIVVAKQTIGRALHHHHILGVRADPAENAEYGLHK